MLLPLLGAPRDTEVVVTEMGARFAGNITALTDIARPIIGVVTHIGLAHAGHLGGPEGIAAVKGELLEALPPAGLAVLNADCSFVGDLAVGWCQLTPRDAVPWLDRAWRLKRVDDVPVWSLPASMCARATDDRASALR